MHVANHFVTRDVFFLSSTIGPTAAAVTRTTPHHHYSLFNTSKRVWMENVLNGTRGLLLGGVALQLMTGY